MADSISAVPQQPFLGRLAEFLRFLEKDRPEFLPRQLGVMQGISQLALPQASTIENLSYGNQPFTMPPSGTGAMIPQVKTGRKAEVADLVSMISGVPGGRAVADVGTKLSNEAADALVRAITRNPQATAPGVIQETAMPFMQAAAPRTPGLLQTPVKSDLGFYSALEQATTPLQNKGTGQQFLAQIEKTAGVKPEEIKWTGLDDFLKSRQNVTKQEVQDYLAANRVNLREVKLAGDGGQSPVFAEYFPDTQKFHVFSNDLRLQGLYDTAEEADAFVKQYNANIPYGPTKFSKYTLPGGENYREILLTLPQKQPEIKPVDTSKWSVVTVQQSPISGARQVQVRDEQGRLVGQRFGFQGSDQDAIQEVLPGRIERKTESAFQQQNFRSSHFDQPNILAHMRVNDRIVDGKKTLFIEEIQSDWHQAGRKKGYGPQTETTHEAYYITPDGKKVSLGFGKTQEEAAAAVDPGWQGVVDIKFDTQTKKVGEGVPDAPFKTSWHELSLKRAIQEASEKGYDKIAFTTGKTQAERYDLSKQIDSIKFNKMPDGNIFWTAYKDGQRMAGADSNPADLANQVGKEVAEKILAKDGPGELSGIDLKIGGEGMKGFYDQILPKSLEKLGKKFDAKVAKTTMDGTEVWSMDITPKMRESIVTKGQPLFAATPAVGLLGDENE